MTVTILPKFSKGLPQHMTYPLQCCVWAYSDPTHQKKALSARDDPFVNNDIGETVKGLAEYAVCLVLFEQGINTDNTLHR